MDKERVLDQGLHFFGNMGIHVSHELKNILAIVSETAGLFDDMTDLMLSGGNVDVSRLKSLSGRIVDQINRCNSAVRDLNTLSHSLDEEVAEIDVSETAAFMTSLSRCLPFSRPVAVDAEPLTLRTRPYQVLNVLYFMVRHAFSRVEHGDEVNMKVSPEKDSARITLFGLGSGGDDVQPLEPGEKLAAELGWDLTSEDGRISLFIRPEG